MTREEKFRASKYSHNLHGMGFILLPLSKGFQVSATFPFGGEGGVGVIGYGRERGRGILKIVALFGFGNKEGGLSSVLDDFSHIFKPLSLMRY